MKIRWASLDFHTREESWSEIKYTDRPAVTASQRLAMECLRLDRLDIICPGNASYPLADGIHVTGLERPPEHFQTIA